MLSKKESKRWKKHFGQYRKRDQKPARAQKVNNRNAKIIALSEHGFGVPEIREIIGGGQTWQIGQVRMDARRKKLW